MSQETIFLYKEIPNSKGNDTIIEETYSIDVGSRKSTFTRNITIPTLTIHLPKKPNGISVLICPGGGYSGLAMDHEGHDMAKRFNESGITAFVLKSRTPLSSHFENKEYINLQDVQRAMQIIHENAKKWKIKVDKIGIVGSSAGGHLAASASVHYKKSLILNPKNISYKPAFTILNYPVISFQDGVTHEGSRQNLIQDEKKEISLEKKNEFSCELHIDENSPPSFLVHALDDDAVKVENSLLYIAAMHRNNCKVASLFYEKGGHGYGMINETSSLDWMKEAIKFIKSLK